MSALQVARGTSQRRQDAGVEDGDSDRDVESSAWRRKHYRSWKKAKKFAKKPWRLSRPPKFVRRWHRWVKVPWYGAGGKAASKPDTTTTAASTTTAATTVVSTTTTTTTTSSEPGFIEFEAPGCETYRTPSYTGCGPCLTWPMVGP